MSELTIDENLVLPEITELSVEETLVQLSLSIPKDLPYFEGHFPTEQVLPGVVQLGWAFKLGAKYFGLEPEYQTIEALKFQQVVFPGTKVQMTLQHNTAKNKLVFKIFDDNHSYSSGRIVLNSHV